MTMPQPIGALPHNASRDPAKAKHAHRISAARPFDFLEQESERDETAESNDVSHKNHDGIIPCKTM